MRSPPRVLLRASPSPREGWAAVYRCAAIEARLRSLLPETPVTVVASGGPAVLDYLYTRVRDLVAAPEDLPGGHETSLIPAGVPVRLVWVDGFADAPDRARRWAGRGTASACPAGSEPDAWGDLPGTLFFAPGGREASLGGAAYTVVNPGMPGNPPRAPGGGGAIHFQLRAMPFELQLQLLRSISGERIFRAGRTMEAPGDLSPRRRRALRESLPGLELVSGEDSHALAARGGLLVVDTAGGACEAAALGAPFVLAPAVPHGDLRGLRSLCRAHGGVCAGSLDPGALAACLRVRARGGRRQGFGGGAETAPLDTLGWLRVFARALNELEPLLAAAGEPRLRTAAAESLKSPNGVWTTRNHDRVLRGLG